MRGRRRGGRRRGLGRVCPLPSLPAVHSQVGALTKLFSCMRLRWSELLQTPPCPALSLALSPFSSLPFLSLLSPLSSPSPPPFLTLSLSPQARVCPSCRTHCVEPAPFLALTPSLPHSLSLSPGEGVPELQDALRRALSTAAASRGGAAGGGAAAAAGAGGGSGTGSGAGKSGPKGVASAASAAAGPTPVAAGAGGVLEDDGPPEVSVGSVNSCCICRRGGRSSGGWCGG